MQRPCQAIKTTAFSKLAAGLEDAIECQRGTRQMTVRDVELKPPPPPVHPLALEALERMRLPVAGLRSKSWDEFAAAGAPPLDFVFTVCDKAAGETCPVWTGQPITAHRGVEDPAAVVGTDERKREVFKSARKRGAIAASWITSPALVPTIDAEHLVRPRVRDHLHHSPRLADRAARGTSDSGRARHQQGCPAATACFLGR